MKIIELITIVLITSSCVGNEKKPSEFDVNKKQVTKDTVISTCPIDEQITIFDTIVNNAKIQMRMYCLNDSSVFNKTHSDERDLNEYVVDHNYATDVTIEKEKSNPIKLIITKETFKDSIPEDFLNISHMWYNSFERLENEKLIFCARLAKPGTDYQFAALYTITEKGAIQIIRIEDESYNDSED